MLPPLHHLGGHESYQKYKAVFDAEYVAGDVADFRGKRILFCQPNFNGAEDCAHVCYATPRSNWYQRQAWKQSRAERILWIGATLRNDGSCGQVRVLISDDARNPKDDTRIYLLCTTADDANAPYEYFCVVTVVKTPDTLCFLTAYDITEKAARDMQQKYRQEWPERKVKPKK